MLMMSLCKKVDVYEYIPSERHTALCHYYEDYQDNACTLGAYHPLLYEKMFVRQLSFSSVKMLRVKGLLKVPGLRSVQCDP